MTLGERIQELRKNAGLSQETLGETLGVTRQSISKWEGDAAIPELDKLIAMSRLFHIPVGVLLGVEEAGTGPEGELTERELAALEVIAQKLVPPPAGKREKWPWVLGVCAAILAVLVTALFFRQRMNGMEEQLNWLQSDVRGIRGEVSAQIAGITGRVERALESQGRITADMGCTLIGEDMRANTVTFRVWAAPKVWQEGMTASFTAAGPELDTVAVSAAEGGGHRFEGEVTCPLTDEIVLSVTFRNGEESQSQVVEKKTGLYTESQPEIGTWGHSYWLRPNEDGIYELKLSVYDFKLSADRAFGDDICYDDAETPLGESVYPTGGRLEILREGKAIYSQELTEDVAALEEKGMEVALADIREGERFLFRYQVTDNFSRQFDLERNFEVHVTGPGEVGDKDYVGKYELKEI